MAFKNIYENRTVLITGNTGFKGAWLSLWLNMLGANVIGYSLAPPTNPSLYEVCGIDGIITQVIGDVRSLECLEMTIRKYSPEVIFHLAAQPLVLQSYRDPVETYETNIMGTVNLLEAAKNCDSVQAVLVITTDKCYENKEWLYGYRECDPMGGYDPYSSSKGCAELIVASFRKSFYEKKGVALSSARAGNVIGGGDWAKDRLIPDFVRALMANEPIEVRNPLATRPWQHVLEPLSGYLWLVALMLEDKYKFSGPWNFGPFNNDVMTVHQVLDKAFAVWGEKSIKYDTSVQPHEANALKLDISKAIGSLKWYPVFDKESTVSKTIEWYKIYYGEKAEDILEFTMDSINEYMSIARDKGVEWARY